jgi:O-antigen/teichoic acid export membrane protein
VRATGRRALGRRTLLGLTDQVISSASNFALSILVVRSVTTDAYGEFALTFAIYTVCRGGIQALVAQPLLVRHTRHLTGGTPADEHLLAYRHAVGGGLALGLVGAAAVTVGALAASGDLRMALLALAVTLPALMAQEVMRAVYFAQGRPAAAIAIDSAWAVGQIAFVGALLWAGNDAVPWLILAWGAAGAASVVAALAVERLAPLTSGAFGWLLGLRHLSAPFFGEIMISLLLTQGVLLVLTAAKGLDDVGVFRSAQILFSPLNVLLAALTLVGIPEGVRLARNRPHRFRAAVIVGTAALTLAVVAWCLAVIALPDQLGERLLGQSWDAAAAILPQSSLYYLGSAVAVGALIGLRALEAPRRSFVARSVGSLSVFVLGSIGAVRSGAAGAALGLGIGGGVTALALWIAYRSVARSSAILSPGISPDAAQPALLRWTR